MVNNWGVSAVEGYESVLVALNDRFRRLIQEAKEKILAGGEKALVALGVEEQMFLFMRCFDRYGVMLSDESVETACNFMFATLCSELDMPARRYSMARMEIYEILKAWNHYPQAISVLEKGHPISVASAALPWPLKCFEASEGGVSGVFDF